MRETFEIKPSSDEEKKKLESVMKEALQRTRDVGMDFELRRIGLEYAMRAHGNSGDAGFIVGAAKTYMEFLEGKR